MAGKCIQVSIAASVCINWTLCCVQVLKWSDYCLPLACSPDQPFRAVAQATVDNFSRLGVAFIEDRLQLDDGLLPSKIVRMLPVSYLYSLYSVVLLSSNGNCRNPTYLFIYFLQHILFDDVMFYFIKLSQ